MVTRIGSKSRSRLYLREWRIGCGLSQEQLAERIGTTKATISRIETRARDATLGFLEASVEALGGGLSVPDLFRPPQQPSIDARLQAASAGERERVYSVVEAMLTPARKKAS